MYVQVEAIKDSLIIYSMFNVDTTEHFLAF